MASVGVPSSSWMTVSLEDGGAGGGWHWVLSSLKTLLETGTILGPGGHNQS